MTCAFSPFSGGGHESSVLSVRRGAFVMRNQYERATAEQIEIQRHLRQGTAKIVSRKFGAVAKVLWPDKTAAHLAAIADTNERTAWRWLSGEFEPPAIVIAAIIVEITKRD